MGLLRSDRRARRLLPTLETLPDRRLPTGLGLTPVGTDAPSPRSVEFRAAATAAWEARAPLPVGRSEVAAAVIGGQIVVIGGALANGSTTARVEAYSPGTDRWRSLPDLPVPLNHAAATSDGQRLYVVGGYAGNPGPATVSRAAFVLDRSGWRALPPLPEGRAAAGAAIAGGRLYVVGGVTPDGLATRALAFDLRTGVWSSIAGPTPREHLGVASLGGRIYAVGGRTAGFDSNLDVLESFRPGAPGWVRLPSVPDSRGGTGLAAIGGRLISAGGERAEGTIAMVFAYDVARRRWSRLADLPTPRHGLGVVATAGRVFAVAGGEVTGGGATAVNESLRLA